MKAIMLLFSHNSLDWGLQMKNPTGASRQEKWVKWVASEFWKFIDFQLFNWHWVSKLGRTKGMLRIVLTRVDVLSRGGAARSAARSHEQLCLRTQAVEISGWNPAHCLLTQLWAHEPPAAWRNTFFLVCAEFQYRQRAALAPVCRCQARI